MSARILVVEDEEPNRDMLKRRLERRGFSVLIAAEGAEACRLIEAERPDLVLMDASMPNGLDGLPAMQRVRENPEIARTPIIVLTAYAMEGDRERFLAAGFDEYVSKPIQFDTLLARMGELLARANGTAPEGA